MTCCEGWTSCNGFGLLVLLLLGVAFNAVPLVVNIVDEDTKDNPISCFEWWFPGIIGAGLMVVPAATMSIASRKRACCNNRTGMFLSSLGSVITVLGAMYCVLVSLQALLEGPLICNSQGNITSDCKFSFRNLSDLQAESFDMQWFYSDSCVPPEDFSPPSMPSNWSSYGLHFSSKENKHKLIHITVFLGLLLVGLLEILFGLSQIIIGFLGCLCGISKRRSVVV